MLDTCLRVYELPGLAPLVDFLPHRHLPVVHGVVCATLEIPLQDACVAFMFTALRSVVASAVRLDRTGPIEVGYN